MSKSQGNVTSPQDIVSQYGADILRLWVVASDYSDDLRIGPEIIKYQTDAYRRLRNTFRFLLGSLEGFETSGKIDVAEMPELERYVLHRLWEIDGVVRTACDEYDFHTMFTVIHNFCAVELSSFYFDIRKDALYCDGLDTDRRRAVLTVLDQVYSCLTAWLAPIICFTAEEAWSHRGREDGPDSVHLRQFPEIPPGYEDSDLAEKWQRIRDVRRVVTGALEVERAAKNIGSSLQANATVYAGESDRALFDALDSAELFITSDAAFSDAAAPGDAFTLDDVSNVAVVVGMADGSKCERCWKVLPEVGSQPVHDDLCGRCSEVVSACS